MIGELLTPVQEELILEWAAALESGRWQQTRGSLKRSSIRDDDKYCCLGVACEIFKRKVSGWWEGNTFYCQPAGLNTLESVSALLPIAVQDLLGVSQGGALLSEHYVYWNEGLEEPSMATDLSEMNDNGVEFPEIATALRKLVQDSRKRRMRRVDTNYTG